MTATVTSIDTVTLTRLVLNPQHRDVARDLADCYRMHQRVTALCCPPDFGPNSRSAAGVLYRIEQSPTAAVVLVQSLTTPDFDRLPAGYATGTTRELGPLLDQLVTGTRVRYRITANPTRRAPAPYGKRGALRALLGEEATRWWHRKAAEAGLEVLEAANTYEETLRGRKNKHRGAPPVTIRLARFDGTAFVTDPEQVRAAVAAGIGRARSYGCGMLSLALLPN